MKLELWGSATLLKKTPTQVFSCAVYGLFKNNYFEEHLCTSASKHCLKRDSNTGAFLWILQIIQEHLFLEGSTNGLFSNTSGEGSFFHKVKTFNSVRKRLPHRYFSLNFENFLGKLFCRTPPINHFSHDAVFFLFADQWGLQPKINSFSGAMVNQGKEFTSPFNPVKLWKSGGNFIVKLLPHMYPLRHSNSWRRKRKGRTEKLVNVG